MGMTNKMNMVTTGALVFLAAGIFTSVSILSAYQILFTISVLYFTYLAIKEKNFKLPASAYWLLAFTLVALISTTINVDIIPKPSKNFGRLKYFIYGAFGIYVFRYWLPATSDKTKKIILNTFLISVIVAGLYVVYRFISDVVILKIDGRGRPLTETMRYGYGSAMAALTLLSAYLHREKLKHLLNPKVLLAAGLIGFLGMFLTYTRGALLGFLVGLPFVLFFYKKRLALWGLLISGIILAGLGGFYLFGSGTNAKFRLLSAKGFSSDQERLSQWQSALYAIKEKPILGWGLSNFHTQVERIKNTYDLGAKHYVDAHSHNVFLEVGAGTGIIGLVLLLAWLFSWAYECFKAGGLISALVIPFGAAFIVSSQFEVTFDANNASMIFALYSLSAAFYSAGQKGT